MTANCRATRRSLKQTTSNASKEIQNVATKTKLGFELGEWKYSIIIPANDATNTASQIKNAPRSKLCRELFVAVLMLPNDQKLSHAAGDFRQPEIRSENRPA